MQSLSIFLEIFLSPLFLENTNYPIFFLDFLSSLKHGFFRRGHYFFLIICSSWSFSVGAVVCLRCLLMLRSLFPFCDGLG